MPTIAPPIADYSELARAVKGEVRWDPIARALYASSASIVEIWPEAVLTPKDAGDVAAAIHFCAKNKIPITPRGAGSGVAGQSLGKGLIIDFSVHMNRTLEINEREGWVRLEPGVVKDDLDAELKKRGLFWPPDPSSSAWCTVGAMVANNSGGAISIRYGTARDYLLELDLMDWRGEHFKLRPVEIAPEGNLIFAPDATETEKRLAHHAYSLVRRNREVLLAHCPESGRCSSGYNLFQLLPLDEVGTPLRGVRENKTTTDGSESRPYPVLDMPRLFCGSEGSLAILLSAKLRVLPLPKAVAGISFSFASNDRMAKGVVELLAHTKPAKLELLDRTFIDVAARAEPELAAGIPANLRTMLILEYFGDDKASVAAQAEAARELIARRPSPDDATPLAFDAHIASDAAGLEKLWRIRKIASPILSRVKGDNKPTRWVEDIAVPPWKLPQFIAGLQAIFERNGFPAALFGHAGEGNLHINPIANVKDTATRARMRKCADEAFELTRSLGGVISGEHGDGVMRTPYLRKMFGAAYDLMVEVKREWDPHWLFNPLTKVMPLELEGTRDITTDFRLGANYSRHATGGALDRPEVLEEIEKCHGCGKCRVYCPLMSVNKEEKHTARAKANLLRAVVGGKLDASHFLGDAEFKENIDLCINCGQCLVECPTQVDIPSIAMAFREQFLERGGKSRLDGVLASPDRVGKLGAAMPALANAAMDNGLVRSVAQATLGIDKRRTMPRYQKAQGLVARKKLDVPAELFAPLGPLPREIALFPGCWANYYDPDGEREAAIHIFEALGVTVHQPKLACCGISKITQGDRAGAAKDLARNVAMLFPLVERGAKVIFSAPSCLLSATHDWVRVLATHGPKRLLPESPILPVSAFSSDAGGAYREKARRLDAMDIDTSEAATTVAAACVDAHALLRKVFEHPALHGQLRPIGVARKNLAYHQPCHSKVSGVGSEPMKLVALIPDTDVNALDAGCCGLSGSFGMKTNNFDMSMKVGSKLFARIETVKPDTVFTPCGVCQTQIRQGAPEQTIVHPLRLLYDAL